MLNQSIFLRDIRKLFKIIFTKVEINHKALLQTGPFAVTAERKSVVDYSQNVYVDSDIFILFLEVKDDPLALLRPFEWEVWLGILLIATFFWCIAGIIDMVYTGKAKWGSLAYFTYGVMLNQGQMVVQMTQASTETRWYKRINFVVWVLGCLVLSTCYSGVHISPQLLSVIQQADLSLW